MVDISAKVICDSIGEHSPRLTTFLVRYPKFVHAEHMRHRTGSYCVSSSRAIPVSRNLEEVRSDVLRAGPVYWGTEQKGMSSGAELDDVEFCITWPVDLPQVLWLVAEHFDMLTAERITQREYAKRLWKLGALIEGDIAEEMVKHSVHKSIVNRRIESDLHVNTLYTSCEPGLLNFFSLRLDKAAQPEIKALAEEMWRVWNESTPQKLGRDDWHLPFIDYKTDYELWEYQRAVTVLSPLGEYKTRVSVAHCARLSYMSFETNKRSTIEEDLALYTRLIESRPIHASPAEHQATPDDLNIWDSDIDFGDVGEEIVREKLRWQHPELHGNLPGWIQYRKTLPNEAIAALPEGYIHG